MTNYGLDLNKINVVVFAKRNEFLLSAKFNRYNNDGTGNETRYSFDKMKMFWTLKNIYKFIDGKLGNIQYYGNGRN